MSNKGGNKKGMEGQREGTKRREENLKRNLNFDV